MSSQPAHMLYDEPPDTPEAKAKRIMTFKREVCGLLGVNPQTTEDRDVIDHLRAKLELSKQMAEAAGSSLAAKEKLSALCRKLVTLAMESALGNKE